MAVSWGSDNEPVHTMGYRINTRDHHVRNSEVDPTVSELKTCPAIGTKAQQAQFICPAARYAKYKKTQAYRAWVLG